MLALGEDRFQVNLHMVLCQHAILAKESRDTLERMGEIKLS